MNIKKKDTSHTKGKHKYTTREQQHKHNTTQT